MATAEGEALRLRSAAGADAAGSRRVGVRRAERFVCRGVDAEAEALAAEAAGLRRICLADSHVPITEVAVVESGPTILTHVQRIYFACKLMIPKPRSVLATELYTAKLATIPCIAELLMSFVRPGRSKLRAAMLALRVGDDDQTFNGHVPSNEFMAVRSRCEDPPIIGHR